MGHRRTAIALVTNARDFAGPPAVDALAVDFHVLVHHKTFAEPAAWSQFSALHPHAEHVKAFDPSSIIAAAWDVAGKVDVERLVVQLLHLQRECSALP